MPSTRRTETLWQRFGPPVVAVMLVSSCLTCGILNFPDRPVGPRYIGAGNSEPRSGGVFRFSIGGDIRSLDPHIAYDTGSNSAVRLVFDGLLDYDHDGNMIPRLLTRMPEVSEDGRTFRFELRQGVHFHESPLFDGPREVTAEDVRWSIERLLHPNTRSPGVTFYQRIVGYGPYRAGEAEHIEGIRVTGRYTVEFTLEAPDQTFLNAMAMPFAYPVPRENYEHWIAQDDPRAVERHPVGTGPYAFEGWERGVQLRFTRNERYWNPQPRPDEMRLIENLGGETAVGRFSNGDLEVLTGMPSVHFLFFRRSEAWAPFYSEEPEPTVIGLVMNCELPPFDDVHVRRAVSFAIDREAIQRAVQGRALPAGQLIPPMIAGHDPELDTLQTFDLERARAEMAQSRYAGNVPPVTLWIAGRGDASALVIPQMWKQDLEEIGISIEFRQVAYSTYLQETGKPGQVQMFRSGWHADFPDPSNFLDILFHSRTIQPENSENRAFYRNPELDAILDEARGEQNAERRLSLYRQANAIVARDAPWAVLYYTLGPEARQPYVMNYRPHPVWAEDYRDVWLDLPRQRVTDAHWRAQ